MEAIQLAYRDSETLRAVLFGEMLPYTITVTVITIIMRKLFDSMRMPT